VEVARTGRGPSQESAGGGETKKALWCNFRTDEEAAFESLQKIDFPQALLTASPIVSAPTLQQRVRKKQLHQFANQSSMSDGKQSLPVLRKSPIED
jgi:hypothetical protein